MTVTQNMKFILVLFCTFSVVFSAPPRQTQVNIDLHGSPARRSGIVVHHIGPAESANVQVSHKHEYRGNDGLVGHTNVHITHGDQDRKQERTEIRLSGVGYSGTSGGFHSTTAIRGASGTQGQIVAYGTGLTVPAHISGNINLF